MLRMSVVEIAQLERTAMIVLAQKKNSYLQIFIGYRNLNSLETRDA